MIFDAISSFIFSFLGFVLGLLPLADSSASGFWSTVLSAFDWLGSILAGFVYVLNGIGFGYAPIPVGSFFLTCLIVSSVFLSSVFGFRFLKWIVELVRG